MLFPGGCFHPGSDFILPVIKPSQSALESFSVSLITFVQIRWKEKRNKLFLERMKTSQEDEGGPGYFPCAVRMFFHSPNDAFGGKETWQTLIDGRCEWLRVLYLASRPEGSCTPSDLEQVRFQVRHISKLFLQNLKWTQSSGVCHVLVEFLFSLQQCPSVSLLILTTVHLTF